VSSYSISESKLHDSSNSGEERRDGIRKSSSPAVGSRNEAKTEIVMPKEDTPVVEIKGSERRHSVATRRVRAAGPDEEIEVALILRQRPDMPLPPTMEEWANTPHDRRRFISHAEADERHGALREDIEKVVAFVTEHGSTVRETHAPRRLVRIAGTIGNLNRAFGITLQIYESPTETYRGYDGRLHLPAEIVDIVMAVFGLDNRRMAARASSGGGFTITNLTPPDVTRLYRLPSVPASIFNQTIGLFEFDGGYVTDSSGNPTDVVAFLQSLNPPLPPPRVTPVSVLGGTNTVLGSLGHTNNDDAEVALDIDVASSVASGAAIAVYFISTNTDIGWIFAVLTAFVPVGTEPSPTVVSISWAWREDDWSASQLQAISSFFRLAGFKGVSVFAASGDKGSMGNADESDGRAHVCFPACDPWVTAVGGTSIGNVHGSSFDEITWNDNGVTAGGISTVTDSSGNLVFPLQSWQVGFNVPPSINDGKTRGRGLPDISAYANGYDIRLYGANAGSWWGTSEASPLCAGLVAVLNARLGFALGWLNATLYQFGGTTGWDIFRDIDDGGSNAFTFTLPPPNPPTKITSPPYFAIKGWDACTGLGAPRADRFFAALAKLPIAATAIEDDGDFGVACTGGFVDQVLTINNSGFGLLAISNITSSNPDFLVPDIKVYPLLVDVGDSIDVVLRFKPSVAGGASGTITIDSNDPSSPSTIAVSGIGEAPRLALAIANSGTFGKVCAGAFRDQPLVLSNSGHCPLSITKVACSSSGFVIPEVQSYPLVIAPGGSLPLPIRFAPPSGGSYTGTITVDSNDPAGPRQISVAGEAPSGKLVISGSAVFGGVRCCTQAQRTLWLCNTGDCALSVSKVAFKHHHHALRLVNDPFPAILHAGSCLPVVVEYRAKEREPVLCELVIQSDDPTDSVKCVDVIAYTICDCCKKETERCECERRQADRGCKVC
jgi:Pro-kumamolisin, activation domain